MESKTISFGYADRFFSNDSSERERGFGRILSKTPNPIGAIRAIHDLCRSMGRIVSVPDYFNAGNAINNPWYVSMTWTSPDCESSIELKMSDRKIRYSDIEFEYRFNSGCICGSFYQKDGSVCPTVSETLLGYECAKTLKEIING